jgi:DNA-binding XRE family transcriptional regulator
MKHPMLSWFYFLRRVDSWAQRYGTGRLINRSAGHGKHYLREKIWGISYVTPREFLFRFQGVRHLPKHRPKHRRILGENIRARRNRAEWSQEKLAEKAELDPTYISDVERGEENISVDALVRIANALKVPLRELLRGI